MPIIPQYQRNTILNLLGSLLQGYTGKSVYAPLPQVSSSEIQHAQSVILMVIDGLGADSVSQLPKNSFLRKYQMGTLQTVFPSTTAAAITTFLTGVSPQEHGFVAWDMYLKEFGMVVQILPYRAKDRTAPKLPKKNLAVPGSFFSRLSVKSHLILKKRFKKSHYNQLFCRGTKFWGYRNLREFGSAVVKAVHSSPGKKYIYAYWPGFDDFSHHFGKNHPQTKQHLRELDDILKRIQQKLAGSNTLLLLTADHGQISTTPAKAIILEKHPLLMKSLSRPLCGEARAAFFYVQPRKRRQFEQYVHQKWGKICQLYRSKDLTDRNYFGLGQRHPAFQGRIGDYIVIPKENYIFKEHLISKKHPFIPGQHGGLSKEEMTVPLIKVLL